MATKQSMIQAKYDAKNSKVYSLKFNRKTDAEIIEKLDQVESRNGYIKQLIREDLARTRPGSVPDSAPDSVPDSYDIEHGYTCEHCANNVWKTDNDMIICHDDGQEKHKNDTCDYWQ